LAVVWLTLVTSVGSLSLWPMPCSTVCPLSISTSHCTICWFCAHSCLYSLPTVSNSHCNVSWFWVHCYLLQPLHCLQNLAQFLCWFCVTVSSAVFCSLSTVRKYLTLYRPLVLCPLLSSTVCPLAVSTSHCTVCWFCVHCCLPESVHCLSVPNTVSSVGFVSVSTAVF